MPNEEREKLKLLTVDKLVMSEVRTFEKMAGYTIQELYQRGADEPMPTTALMALAFLTEKRTRPAVKRETYERLSFGGLMKRLESRFEFEQVESADGEDENPTPAA